MFFKKLTTLNFSKDDLSFTREMSHDFIYFILFELLAITVSFLKFLKWLRNCGKLRNTDYESFILVV